MTLIFFIYENVRGKNEYGGHSTSKYTINVWKCLPITVCSRGIGKCLAIYQLIDKGRDLRVFPKTNSFPLLPFSCAGWPVQDWQNKEPREDSLVWLRWCNPCFSLQRPQWYFYTPRSQGGLQHMYHTPIEMANSAHPSCRNNPKVFLLVLFFWLRIWAALCIIFIFSPH